MELAPFLFASGTCRRIKDYKKIGCQGFSGPLPSAFLDKCPVVAGMQRTNTKIVDGHSVDQIFFYINQQEFFADYYTYFFQAVAYFPEVKKIKKRLQGSLVLSVDINFLLLYFCCSSRSFNNLRTCVMYWFYLKDFCFFFLSCFCSFLFCFFCFISY